MKTTINKLVAIFISLIILLGGIYVFQESKFKSEDLRVVFCDVGQGDAIYIKTPGGQDILIDGGPDEKVLNCLSKNMPFWDREIELIVATHPDADHITGLISVLDRYSLINYVSEKTENQGILVKKLQAKLAEKKITANSLKSGDRIVFADQTKIEVLWPSENVLKNNTIALKNSYSIITDNDLSIVTLLTYGDFKLLLTGDAGVSVLSIIQDEIGDIDILKVPHHGSKTGMDQKILSSITPEVAVISVGKNNRYGHPAKQIMELLLDNNIKTLRTDQVGDIQITSNGKSYALMQ